MEYRISQEFEPDKILEWKLKKDEKVKLPILKDIRNHEKIVGYLTHNNVYEENMRGEYKYLLFKDKIFYLNEKRQYFSGIIGFIPVSDTEVVAVTKSFVPILLFILCFIAFIFCMDFTVKNNNTDNPKKDITNPNQIASDDIPDYQEAESNTPNVWISGSSSTKVNADYKNVYLENDKENDGYYMVYEVYSADNNLLYKTGYIAPGTAEPFNAYDCDGLHSGKNDIYYEVYFYDSNLFCVASSTVNGLTIIKN